MASQLTIEERQRISQLRFTEGVPTRIGKAIGRDRQERCVEDLRCNCVQGAYSAVVARNLRDARR